MIVWFKGEWDGEPFDHRLSINNVPRDHIITHGALSFSFVLLGFCLIVDITMASPLLLFSLVFTHLDPQVDSEPFPFRPTYHSLTNHPSLSLSSTSFLL